MLITPIYFQFDDPHAAVQALDTLRELGYHAHPMLQVIPEQNNLTAALEIVQSQGGTLVERLDALPVSEAYAYSAAYDLEGLPIPAHLVAEDFSEAYMHPGGPEGGSRETAGGAEPDAGPFAGPEPPEDQPEDPSSDTYDRFPAGIRL